MKPTPDNQVWVVVYRGYFSGHSIPKLNRGNAHIYSADDENQSMDALLRRVGDSVDEWQGRENYSREVYALVKAARKASGGPREAPHWTNELDQALIPFTGIGEGP